MAACSLSLCVAVGTEDVEGLDAQRVVVGRGGAGLGGQRLVPGEGTCVLVLEAQVGVSFHQLRHRRGCIRVPRLRPLLLQAFAPTDDINNGDPQRVNDDFPELDEAQHRAPHPEPELASQARQQPDNLQGGGQSEPSRPWSPISPYPLCRCRAGCCPCPWDLPAQSLTLRGLPCWGFAPWCCFSVTCPTLVMGTGGRGEEQTGGCGPAGGGGFVRFLAAAPRDSADYPGEEHLRISPEELSTACLSGVTCLCVCSPGARSALRHWAEGQEWALTVVAADSEMVR